MHTQPTLRNDVRTVTIPALPERPASPGKEGALKIYDTLLVVMGIVGAAVSGWSIATLLHDDGGMPWEFAGLGVGVYDLLAFMAGLMVYIRRHEPHRAVGAQVLMALAVGGSAYVNYMHGIRLNGVLVALLLGAAPVSFEIAFAMRHNVLTVTTAILFPRAMWRRYKEGVWIKLHTGSLPAHSGTASGSLPEAGAQVPEAAEPEVEALPEALPEASRKLPEAAEAAPDVRRAVADRMAAWLDVPADVLLGVPSGSLPEAVAEALPEAVADSRKLPEASGSVPEGPEARAEAVAEALRKGERITGTTVGSMYGVSDSMGRTYIRRAKEINAARDAVAGEA